MGNIWAQKKPLDYSVLGTWPEITGEKISNDGRFVLYSIYKKSTATASNIDWYVKATDNSWQRQLKNASQASVTSDSRYIVYLQGTDSIVVYDPVKNIPCIVLPGNSYQLSMNSEQPLLGCIHRAGKVLRLYDINRMSTGLFSAVDNFEMSANGKTLLIVADSAGKKYVKRIDLTSNNESVIASGAGRFSNFVFDASFQQLVFTEEISSGTETLAALRYFRPGMDTAIIKVSPGIQGLDSGYVLRSLRPRFNKSGTKIFFTVNKKAGLPEKDKAKADVNVWHYNDVYLPGEQAFQLANTVNYTAIVPVNTGKIIQLTRQGDNPLVVNPAEMDAGVVVVSTRSNYFSVDTSAANKPSHYLVNTTTGERKLLVSQQDIAVSLSPEERFAVWFDPVKDVYNSYDIQTSQLRIITQSLKGLLKLSPAPIRLIGTMPYGIAGWLPEDSAMLVYDQYDIWKVDPGGIHTPVNITKGYGRRNKIMLRVWNEGRSDYDAPVISQSILLLSAFDTRNNRNGFFSIDMQQAKEPLQLTMDDCLYYAHQRFNLPFLRSASIYKAEDTNIYLLRRMRADQYPELFITPDFKNFTQLTTLQPEAGFNWMKAEHIQYSLADGRQAAAVLYKPTDFDPAKKYPVIFYFYEKLSHRLHQYISPILSDGSLNIPFLVSNGYLVCTPDIVYTKGKPGASALEYVSAAVNYLGKLSYIDAKKMGIQGHSFGGYQVNYIITKTRLFAAAQASAGAADFISYYNGNYRESSAQFYFEKGQARIGHTLWQAPELFQQNSPIFFAPKVTTPLLLMHNKEDGEVPFQQGLEWFTALKRLGKKVWMLQYDKEYHGINQYKNQLDFTIRMKQFFDHYLKGIPQPVWMKQGLPVTLKGLVDGLDIEW